VNVWPMLYPSVFHSPARQPRKGSLDERMVTDGSCEERKTCGDGRGVEFARIRLLGGRCDAAAERVETCTASSSISLTFGVHTLIPRKMGVNWCKLDKRCAERLKRVTWNWSHSSIPYMFKLGLGQLHVLTHSLNGTYLRCRVVSRNVEAFKQRR
jgi:hypothetical protein